MDNAYSVLMSVYAKEKPAFFEEAIGSMLRQTVPTRDFVIVCDGELTPELDAILERYDRENPGVFHIVRLPQNMGIGVAAQAGLRECKYNLVAKMDADDISVSDRCELQLKQFAQKPELTVIGSNIDEFDADPEAPYSSRCVPEDNEGIRKFARRRQPFNNMTVMYKKDAVQAVGGYRALPRNEDYDLYVRLLAAGYYAENIPQSLVKVRVNADAVNRRASAATLKGCIVSRWNAFRIGYSSLWDFLYCVLGQLVVFVCPPKAQNWIYAKFLRKNDTAVAEGKEAVHEQQ